MMSLVSTAPPRCWRWRGGNCRGVSNWNIKVFAHQPKDNYKLFAEDIKEISFPADKIKRALRAQFASVQIIDRARRTPSRQSEQLFFLYQK